MGAVHQRVKAKKHRARFQAKFCLILCLVVNGELSTEFEVLEDVLESEASYNYVGYDNESVNKIRVCFRSVTRKEYTPSGELFLSGLLDNCVLAMQNEDRYTHPVKESAGVTNVVAMGPPGEYNNGYAVLPEFTSDIQELRPYFSLHLEAIVQCTLKIKKWILDNKPRSVDDQIPIIFCARAEHHNRVQVMLAVIGALAIACNPSSKEDEVILSLKYRYFFISSQMSNQ